jgi:hypothetical protein
MRRGLETEGDRIADVEIPDPDSPGFRSLGRRSDISDRIGEPADTVGHSNRGCHVRSGHRFMLLVYLLFPVYNVLTASYTDELQVM